jgi:uncharacterized protein involved in exopolysaccharide biosynthesis
MKRNKNKLNLFHLLLNNRVFIYYFAISFTLLFLLYSFIAIPKYVSVGQLLPSMSSSSPLQLLQNIDLGDNKISRMARAAGLSLGATSGDILSAVLQSRTIKERVVQESGLNEHYNIPIEKTDKILRTLDGATRIDVTPADIVIIEVEDRDPKTAKEIVDNYIAALDNFLRESGMTRGKHERIFLEERLKETTEALKVSEDSFVAFQEKHRIIHLSEEIKMGIELYAQLKAALQAKEIGLKMKLGYVQKENPEIIELKQQIGAYKNKLKELEMKSNLEGYGIGSSISLKDLPNIELEYLRLFRTVKENETIYAFLAELYEQAKISEVRDTPIITVIDYGAIPQRPEFPRKFRMTAYGFFIGLIFSIVYILFGHFSRVFLQNPRNKYVYEALKDALLTDIKSIKRLFRR